MPAYCSETCRRQVTCGVCKKRKAPRGRSVAAEATSGYCTRDCDGYWKQPIAGHLWPRESLVDGDVFDFPHAMDEVLSVTNVDLSVDHVGAIRLPLRVGQGHVATGQRWWITDGVVRVLVTIEDMDGLLCARPDWSTRQRG